MAVTGERGRVTNVSKAKEVFANGEMYEPYVGRWSRLVARGFLEWVSPAPGARWLDVGCGTGALSGSIVAHASPREVVGIDPSAGFVGYARQQVKDPRVHFEVGDARALPCATGAFDAVVSGLVLNFVPDPSKAAEEMARATRVGGTVAAYVWDYAGKMEFMRYFWDAAVALDPAAFELDEGRRFSLCQPGPLADLFRGVGLNGVEVRAIDIPTTFKDFDDFWTPFLGGQGSAPGYAMSLDKERREQLRDRIRVALPFQADGTIHLMARAWAVRARR